MSDKVKNAVTAFVFLLLLGGGLLAFILSPASAVSKTERRKLSQLPEMSSGSVLSGKYFTDFEDYALDQFPLRDKLRTLAAFTRFDLLFQKDSNRIYIVNGTVGKLEYPLNEASVAAAGRKFAALAEKYMADCRVFCTVIPDKNRWLAADNGYPAMDYDLLERIFAENAAGLEYFPISDALSPEDYYATDTHWKQQNLGAVVDRIGEAMGFTSGFDASDYTQRSRAPFYGVYYGQAALPVPPDELVWLTNDALESAEVFNYETNAAERVYMTEKLDGNDPYDVFLTGACPLLTVRNPAAATQKRLILFRDSFGSSLAPLLAAEYAEITLVDLRYISSDLLADYVDFAGADVLIMLSTLVLNNSAMLK